MAKAPRPNVTHDLQVPPSEARFARGALRQPGFTRPSDRGACVKSGMDQLFFSQSQAHGSPPICSAGLISGLRGSCPGRSALGRTRQGKNCMQFHCQGPKHSPLHHREGLAPCCAVRW
ncbi:uncharacterized protein PGTG_02701 [Puccinia graminis f. sp. tritici CRL 75-36-700-3]|uniref:Uncharacterized protein n=1 Tax=Puccinia graminis f. sp. tritici (strain CRL 75-36-700-3 / race SCCL) TaxID=418459 RepID=E3JW35_PUCGT|nr:uncharacterized protein PGTG_02701 [Puccinia graminis f. sp. tritici CRL 75-36-700-3]EFP76260.1 hypothetical protein PGTG_02701 [Puccinia graminis f. sp. tritici CRL 75-36-700-3]